MVNLNTIKKNLFLQQSELFGHVYDNTEKLDIATFNEISISDIDDWYNSILTKYTNINDFQTLSLNLFFAQLKNVLKIINPEKLNINNELVDESDIMLWRETRLGISKLIFDEYGEIIYQFNGIDGAKQKGVFSTGVDMEKLLYKFLSK